MPRRRASVAFPLEELSATYLIVTRFGARVEVVLIRVDFHQTPGGKLRPALVLLDSGDDAPVDQTALTAILRRAFSRD